MQVTTQGAPEVIIKARGKFISRAVDVAEVVSKRFLEGQINMGNIKIDSEEFTKKVVTSEGLTKLKSMNIKYLVVYMSRINTSNLDEIHEINPSIVNKENLYDYFTSGLSRPVFANHDVLIYKIDK